MEGNKCSLNPHDELRRLQDKVRKLELQNEQLRTQQFLRNGLFENKQSIISSLCSEDSYSKRLELSNNDWDDHFLKAEELSNEEFQDEETWLCKSRHDNPPIDIFTWLHQDIDNHSNYEIQKIRNMLIQKIDNFEQGLRQNSIDTRTFTRPKKKVNHPSLESMLESPILENKDMESPWRNLLSQQITETIDDFSLKYDYTLPSFSTNYNTFNKNDSSFNSTFLKLVSDSQLNASPDPLLNSTFVVADTENLSQKLSDSDLSASSRKGSDISLNTTFLKADGNQLVQNITMSRTVTPSCLNSTFSVADKSSHHSHPASCDSGADDDQLSSASDSSFSSSARLMNVGDVQNIARLQEQSLKQMTSTPKQVKTKDGTILCEETRMSPIKRSTPDLHHGYLSDHSDHSSAEGKMKSSKSSVRSSPAGSPFGSTYALMNECPQPVSVIGPKQEVKGFRQVPPTLELRKSETATKSSGLGRARPISGLRPPSVRSGATALNRPTSVGGSNIPRPASRIPAPRVRANYSTQPPTKVDWMDGCY